MIEVIRSGMQTTVQGQPRQGFRAFGIGSAGALDTVSLKLANLLVANEEDEAALEITLGQITVIFHQPTWIALTGADCFATLSDKTISIGWCYEVKAGDVLVLQQPNLGMRSYLAVNGGIDVEAYLGSYSTDLNSKFGGYEGRAIQANDRLKIKTPTMKPIKTVGIQLPYYGSVIRALIGSEYDQFSKIAKARFWHSEWQLSPQSSRIGFRLIGPELVREVQQEMASHGLLPGIIQVPHNGQPIVLMADAQTTGGYPKIACVIEADLPHIAQVRLGERIKFEYCTLEAAFDAYQQQINYLKKVKRGLDANRSEC